MCDIGKEQVDHWFKSRKEKEAVRNVRTCRTENLKGKPNLVKVSRRD